MSQKRIEENESVALQTVDVHSRVDYNYLEQEIPEDSMQTTASLIISGDVMLDLSRDCHVLAN